MSWITEVDRTMWDGELGELKRSATDPVTGEIDNIVSVHSLDPDSLRAHLELYTQAMRPTNSLPKVDRELIAIVVSKINGCVY